MISVFATEQIKECARLSYPEEMCGFVIDDSFVPVNNTHPNPKEHFRVDPEDWSKYAFKCTAFIHSHPDWHPCPSESDMVHQISSGIPWGIVSTDGERTTEITLFGDQVEIPELLNRTFCHGVTDCYSIIRHERFLRTGHMIKDIPRSWEWWEDKDKDLYTDHFQEVGYHIVPNEAIMKEGPKIGDVPMANVGPGVLKLNHAGVYVGKGLMVHHLTSKKPVDGTRLARKEPIQRWIKYINLWVRHNDEEDSITG